MASTTALFTGLSALNANARNLDVIGNNIANVNTTAFKSSRMLFSNQFSRTFSSGTQPGTNTGGTNPTQVGLGVLVAGTQRDFTGGAISASGDARDLAIEGNGFFVVNRGTGTPYYTRAGAFRQNATNDLITISGERLQGYGVDANFNIDDSQLVDLNIPVGTLTLAEATRNVRFAGNLNAGGPTPTVGSRIDLSALTLLGSAAPPPGPGNVLELTSRIVDLDDPANAGFPLFAAGQSLELGDATKGSKNLAAAALDIDATTTIQDLIDFLVGALGINTTVGNNPDGRTPGATLDTTTGVLSVTGNTGTVNDLVIDSTDLRVLNADGSIDSRPFTPTKTATADGESVRTSFVVYDSLGTPLTADLTMVLESKDNNGTNWRYYAESSDDTDLSPILGTGTVSFDNFGALVGDATLDINITRDSTGAASPLVISLAFESTSDNVTALTDVNSALAATYQDGTSLGTLAAFGVGSDGVITGAFTNGITRNLGQVVLATFANQDGLVDAGGNLFSAGSNSGSAQIKEPLELGAGRVVGGALELSNVDLSQEFINMILASTGYSAASRVITTTDQLMQQLLVIGR